MFTFPRTLASLALAAAALAAAPAARADCSHATTIENNSGITLRIAELKSASSPPFFKRQWTGEKIIPAGESRTISWTSDLSCTDASGVENHWDVRLIRNNGNEHYCSYMRPGQDVRINTPDLCFLD